MIGKIADIFGFDNENLVEDMMLDDMVLSAINLFFTADGPPKIIITFETAASQKIELESKASALKTKHGNNNREQHVDVDSLKDRLRVHVNEVDYLPKAAIYFLKNKKGNSEKVAIDPEKINDGALTFGVIHEPLESFEVMMRCVYKPLISSMGPNLWGSASSEQKNEFMQSIDMFTKGLQESIRSISGGIDLKKPDERVEELGSGAANNPTLVMNSLNLLQDWCTKIEKYLDDSDRSRWETVDSGPDTELEYWRSRMLRLVCMSSLLIDRSIYCCLDILQLVLFQL